MGNPASFEAGMLGEGAFWGGNIPEGDAGRSLGPARGMIGIMGSFLNSLSNMLTYGTMAAPAQAPMTMVNVESVAQGIAMKTWDSANEGICQLTCRVPQRFRSREAAGLPPRPTACPVHRCSG